MLLYACDNENDNSNENSSITVRRDTEWENGNRSMKMDKVSLHFPLSAFKALEFFRKLKWRAAKWKLEMEYRKTNDFVPIFIGDKCKMREILILFFWCEIF